MRAPRRTIGVRLRPLADGAAWMAAACAVATAAAQPAAAVPEAVVTTAAPVTASRPSARGTPLLPRDFSVTSFSTTSNSRWWVAGAGADGRAVLLRTDDAGARWVRGYLPPLAVDTADAGRGPQVAFSGRNRGIFTTGGGIWATRDGGRTWRYGGPWDAAVTTISSSPDAGYALLRATGGWYLTRAAAGSVDLRDVLRPAQLGGTTPSVATSGKTVVVVAGNRVWRSTDDGHRFSREPGPCTEELGGSVSVAGSTAVTWCATGMDGTGFVSTDRGAVFHPVRHAVGVNSAAAAATGVGATIVFAAPTGGVIRACNGSSEKHSGVQLGPVGWIGYSTPRRAFAIAGTHDQQLWRSTDGGATWTIVSFRHGA